MIIKKILLMIVIYSDEEVSSKENSIEENYV